MSVLTDRKGALAALALTVLMTGSVTLSAPADARGGGGGHGGGGGGHGGGGGGHDGGGHGGGGFGGGHGGGHGGRGGGGDGDGSAFPGWYEPDDLYATGPAYSVAQAPGWVAYCAQRYRSFEPRTATYLGYDGREHACR